MQYSIVVAKNAGLGRVPFNESLLNMMLLGDQPIIAMSSDIFEGRSGTEDQTKWCHIIRVEDAWPTA